MSAPPHSRSMRSAADLTAPMSRWSAVTGSQRPPRLLNRFPRPGQVAGRSRGEVKDRADRSRYVDARDRRAPAGQRHGGRTPDAAGGPRDHRHPSGQISWRSLGSSVCHQPVLAPVPWSAVWPAVPGFPAANRPDPACWPNVTFPARNATRTRAAGPHGATYAGRACVALPQELVRWAGHFAADSAERREAWQNLGRATRSVGSRGPRPPTTETDGEVRNRQSPLSPRTRANTRRYVRHSRYAGTLPGPCRTG